MYSPKFESPFGLTSNRARFAAGLIVGSEALFIFAELSMESVNTTLHGAIFLYCEEDGDIIAFDDRVGFDRAVLVLSIGASSNETSLSVEYVKEKRSTFVYFRERQMGKN